MSDVDDRDELRGYVEIWWQAVSDLTGLLDELPDDAWNLPTDLPGWDVRACAAHIAHLESALAGGPEEIAEIGQPEHVTGAMGAYTEIGVVTRRQHSPHQIIEEIRAATTRRHEQLLGDPPTDGDAPPDPTFPGVPWTTRQLLRNRPLDVWMHEQDIRRATSRPGHLDTAPARHTAAYLAEGFGFVLAKRVGAPPGTSAVLEVETVGALAFAVDERGRGRRLPQPPERPTVALGMDLDSFIRLAGGRGAPDADRVKITGDAELGERVLARMATTP